KAIKLPNRFEWFNTKKNKKFLNTINQKWLSFNLKGITDIAILTKGYSGCMGQERIRCRSVIELKKPENIDAKAQFQTQAELITANY
ncbi:830_t:CDS:1, partial [Rhizophagus irregularis]